MTYFVTTHGMTGSPEYAAWKGAKQRCTNKNHSMYRNYGLRGIKLCDRWHDSFENFLSDMGMKPSPSHSIDRKDNDGNYDPDNCRWATATQQQRNRGIQRNNVSGVNGVSFETARRKWAAYIKVNGKTKHLGRFTTIAEAAGARRLAEARYW